MILPKKLYNFTILALFMCMTHFISAMNKGTYLIVQKYNIQPNANLLDPVRSTISKVIVINRNTMRLKIQISRERTLVHTDYQIVTQQEMQERFFGFQKVVNKLHQFDQQEAKQIYGELADEFNMATDLGVLEDNGQRVAMIKQIDIQSHSH